MIGKKFYKLTVLERTISDKNRHIKYRCLCECGNETIVYKSNLISGHTKSCGCDKWKNDFQAFYDWAIANGYSDELTIDRIDNDLGYNPNNCRWATYSQQNKNRKKFKRKKEDK